MDEIQAIQQLKQGNPAGLEALVKKYQVQAVRAAFLVVWNHELAEDIVQTAFLRVYERIQQFDPQRPFGPWFFKIVVNETNPSQSAIRMEIPPILTSSFFRKVWGAFQPVNSGRCRRMKLKLYSWLDHRANTYPAASYIV
ncbi:MAG: sigma factor [Anaerolineales bacterium]|jgi:hypothetical protein